jgi:GT2 family glycosyltransferase/glycosyltransferase involved in cell wall biosynthesis/SAM-dependent methyltransferase
MEDVLLVEKINGDSATMAGYVDPSRMYFYDLAMAFVDKKRVLDLNCQDGYGAYFLAERANSVVGLFQSQVNISGLHNEKNTDNVAFVVSSPSQLPFENNYFDVAIAHGVLECASDNQSSIIEEIRRVVNPEGILIISVKRGSQEIGKKQDDFSENRISMMGFASLLENFSEQILFLCKKDKMCDVLCSNGKKVKFSGIGEDDFGYLVAVCGDLDESAYLRSNVQQLTCDLYAMQKNLYKTKWRLSRNQERLLVAKDDLVILKNRIVVLEQELFNIKKLPWWRMRMAWRHPVSFIKDFIAKSFRTKKQAQSPMNALQVQKDSIYDLFGEAEHSNNDIANYKPLVFCEEKEVLVSIIIPVFNQFIYTYNCLKSILYSDDELAYEVIVADDNSTDITQCIKNIVKNIRVVRNEENLNFVKNCNNAARYARGKYIVFLNNDTRVLSDWLPSLVELMEQDEKIGLAGSKLIFHDGTLQEAGGIVWRDGTACNYGRGSDPDLPEYNYVKEVDYVSGASIMVRKAVWTEIGGFDERFAPAYYEDTDLAFQIRSLGYKVVYQPKSVVVHFEGISNGRDTSSGLKAYQVANHKKFCEKWKNVLEREQVASGEKVFFARDRSKDKKTLVMVDHYVPQFDRDAGSKSVFQYLKLFVEQGLNVKFIGDNFAKYEPYTNILQQMGIEVLYGPQYANSWQSKLCNMDASVDYFFLSRPHIAARYIDTAKEVFNARIIYYGHDLHYLRELREYEITKDKQFLKSSNKSKIDELAMIKNADISCYLSQFEVDEIKKIDAALNIVAVPGYIYDEEIFSGYTFADRTDILFVGGFNHRPNVDSAKWLVSEILPLIQEKIPEVKLHIVGSNAPDSVKSLASSRVIFHGYVSDERLMELYRMCRLVVVPLRYGAGVKNKVVEAMHYGVPVVTTSIGAEGLENIEDCLCIADDAETFASKVISLYNNEASLRKLAKCGIDYVNSYYSKRVALKAMKLMLGE